MKKPISRFALLAIVGSILCSALVAGCGGSSDEDTSTPAAGADKTEKAAGGAEGDGS